MPPSLPSSLDPEALRASWSKWFAARGARLTPDVVKSYQIPNIKDW